MNDFWEKYAAADIIERRKLLTPIIKNFESTLVRAAGAQRQLSLALLLQSYFDDLVGR